MATFTEEEWAALPETPFPQRVETEAEYWRRIQARAQALHAERMDEAEERAKRNAIEIGKLYSITPKKGFKFNEFNQDGHKLLVKVIDKSNNFGEFPVYIIRDYDMPHLNKSYSPQPEVVYIDFHKYIFEKATKNEITFADKKQRLNRFKRNLTNLRTTKKAPLPNNVKGLIGSYISGLNKKSLKNQDAALKKHIKALEKNLSSNKPSELLRGGTRKRRFKSSKRKTT